jgi:signal peptidase II
VGAVAIGLILGGALGNLLDRTFREGDGLLGGHVVDFVDLQWWPVFNVADAAVSVGGVLLVLHLIFGEGRVSEGASAGPGAGSG